jgi:hypothetical protein
MVSAVAERVDVHLTVKKLRRRLGWIVVAVEGLPRLPARGVAAPLHALAPRGVDGRGASRRTTFWSTVTARSEDALTATRGGLGPSC